MGCLELGIERWIYALLLFAPWLKRSMNFGSSIICWI